MRLYLRKAVKKGHVGDGKRTVPKRCKGSFDLRHVCTRTFQVHSMPCHPSKARSD